MIHSPGTFVVRAVHAALTLAASACVTASPVPPVSSASRPLESAEPQDPIPAHDTLTLTSRALREARPVNVHVPTGYVTSGDARYPVLYMPDGGIDEDFPHVVNTVDSLIALGLIRPVIVVGVPNTERRRDLTGPTRVKSDSAIARHVGGSERFRRFLRDELVPAIDARYRTTPERGLVGESLAGLFVVETFLREPAAFTHYVAFDPSLWWNRALLVDSAAALLTAMSPGTSGAVAAPLPRRTLYIAASRDDRDDATDRLREALRVTSLSGVRWTYEPRPDLTHATIFRALAPSAFAQALR